MGLLTNKPRQWKSMLNHQGWFNLLIYTTFTPTTNYRVCYLHIYLYPTPTITLLPPPISLVPRLGLGNTWVRQLRSGSCHYPTVATKCNVTLLANKPRQWKSMLNHHGWFNLLIYTTFTPTTNYRVCNLHIYLYPTPTVTLLPPPISLVPRLGLGNTWVRQLLL